MPDAPSAPLDHLIAALSDPDPKARIKAAQEIRSRGPEGLRAVPALLPAFRDPDPMVAVNVRSTIAELGDAVLPVLQRIRSAGPGRLRAAALTALAELGGEASLSARDAAAIERLIRVKLHRDRPQPLTACWLYWMAVRGGDQQGIMRLLGLTAPRLVTFELGDEIVDFDGHCSADEGLGSPIGRVLVTPELDGWTLVAGAWCDPCDAERGEDVLRQCTELSACYGSAQAYYFGAQNDGSAWLVAENGVVVRRYKEAGEADDWQWTLGEPLDCERAWRAELGLPPTWDDAARDDPDNEAEDEWKSEAFGLAPRIAAALSIDPLTIGPETPMRGTPLIALTSFGVAEGVPYGAYRI
jgi:hypothetical protein